MGGIGSVNDPIPSLVSPGKYAWDAPTRKFVELTAWPCLGLPVRPSPPRAKDRERVEPDAPDRQYGQPLGPRGRGHVCGEQMLDRCVGRQPGLCGSAVAAPQLLVNRT